MMKPHDEAGTLSLDKPASTGRGENEAERSPEPDASVVEAAQCCRSQGEAVGERHDRGESEAERDAEEHQPGKAVDQQIEGESDEADEAENDDGKPGLAPAIGYPRDQGIADEARKLDGGEQQADFGRPQTLGRQITGGERQIDPGHEAEGQIEEAKACRRRIGRGGRRAWAGHVSPKRAGRDLRAVSLAVEDEAA